MNKKYEAIIVFDPDLDEDGIKSQIERIESTVREHQGAIQHQDLWGRRPLGFPIKKKQYGIMVLFLFEGDNTLVGDLRRQLRINDQVLRTSIVKKDKFAPDYSPRAGEDNVESRSPRVDY